MFANRAIGTAILAIIAVCSPRGDLWGEEGKLLRWKFTPGQEWTFAITQQFESESSFGDRRLRMSSELGLEQVWMVKSIDDAGVATVEQRVRRLKSRYELPPASPVEYDSAATRPVASEARSLAQALKPLIGATSTLRLTSRGEFLEVRPSPELEQALTGIADKSAIRELFTPERFADLTRQGMVVLPETEVHVGSEWPAEREVTLSVGRMKQTTTYRYEGAASSGQQLLDKITSSSKLAWTGTGRAATNREVKLQRQEGYLLFDNEHGRPVESESTQQLRTQSRVRDTLLETQLTSTLRTKLVVAPE